MRERSSVYIDGIIDVSIIVPACFDNPIRDKALRFLEDALIQEIRVKIPVSAILGAYHITTRYLRAPREPVGRILKSMLETFSPAFFSDISPRLAISALEEATSFNIESWDGYLIAVARLHRTNTIFSLDRSLERVPGIRVVMPFTEEEVEEYHDFITDLLRKNSQAEG